MELQDFIRIGDFVQAVPRSTADKMVRGTVVLIEGPEAGNRNYAIVQEGQTLERDGAVGINEREYVFSVQRGDILLHIPSLITLAEATEKAQRSLATQARKNQKDFPLFADQAPVKVQDPAAMVRRFREAGQEELDRELPLVEEVNALRDQVQAVLSADDYAYALSRAQSYPANVGYRKRFWAQQLEYAREHGTCERIVFPQSVVRATAALAWMKLDGPAIWKNAPEHPLRVRILFFGREEVMVGPSGEAIRDYNPKLVAPTVWLRPEELEEDSAGWNGAWVAALPEYLRLDK